jgi:glucuronate isomerase
MKNCFLAENFLLSTTTSEKLYFQFAQHLPIFDYHCHIPPADIAQNKRYENLTRIWLAEGHYGDHYKWRAMRASLFSRQGGIAESLAISDPRVGTGQHSGKLYHARLLSG